VSHSTEPPPTYTKMAKVQLSATLGFIVHPAELLFGMCAVLVGDLTRLAAVGVPSHTAGGDRSDVAGLGGPPLQQVDDLRAWHTERGAQLVVDRGQCVVVAAPPREDPPA
jgi:hypothetical protein